MAVKLNPETPLEFCARCGVVISGGSYLTLSDFNWSWCNCGRFMVTDYRYKYRGKVWKSLTFDENDNFIKGEEDGK